MTMNVTWELEEAASKKRIPPASGRGLHFLGSSILILLKYSSRTTRIAKSINVPPMTQISPMTKRNHTIEGLLSYARAALPRWSQAKSCHTYFLLLSLHSIWVKIRFGPYSSVRREAKYVFECLAQWQERAI
jgi:hypothetical protein